jgi:hypothetical protein
LNPIFISALFFPAAAQQGALFVEDSARALPGVRTTCGTPAKDYIIEVNGGGLGLGDFDGDGDLDLVVVDGSTLERIRADQPGFPPRLFLNDGNGVFAPAGESWSMSGGRWGMGCATGDLNGDGWLDLVISQWGPDRVFLNAKGAGLREVSSESGLIGSRWGTSAVLFDYDGDGVLDLAQINYLGFDPDEIQGPGGECAWKGYPVMCGPEGLIPVHDQLYRGRGDGRFEERTRAAGFVPREAGFGLGGMALDYDLDGDTDLFVSNDSTPNHLWENQGDGTFEEVGFTRGVSHDSVGKEQACMGIGCGDLDGDGRPDLLVTNFSGEANSLYLSRGKGFRERSAPSGLAGPSVPLLGWGTALGDFDLDGDLDGFCVNGHVYPQADRPGTDTSYAQVDLMFRNDGSGHFQPEPLSGAPARVSRASTVGDIDADGDLDIVFIELDGEVIVLRNRTRQGDSEGAPHWLGVSLAGGRDVGAVVRAEWKGGQRAVEIRTCGGFQAAVPARAHFGLGAAERVDRLTVTWPGGEQRVLEDVAADRLIEIRRGDE